MHTNARLNREVIQSSGWFGSLVLLNLATGFLVILQSRQISHAVDMAFLKGQTLPAILPTLWLLAGAAVIRFGFSSLAEMTGARFAIKAKNELRDRIFEKIGLLGSGSLRGEKIAELTTTTLQGVDALDVYFSQYLPQVLVSAFLPLMILAFVFPLDWLSGLVLLLTAPLIPLFMVLIGSLAEALTKKQWSSFSRLADYFLDTLQGIATLKALGRSKDRLTGLQENNEEYRSSTMRVFRVAFLSALVLELVATLSTALVAVQIGLRLLNGRIGFEYAFFILLIAPEFYQPLRNLSLRFHAGMKGVAAAQRIYQFLDTPEQLAEPTIVHNSPLALSLAEDYQLRFFDVCFRYPDRTQNAIFNLSFEIQPGQHVALAGCSGAGKSTIARLLIRSLHPESGAILLNGQNYIDFSLEDWHNAIAWVPQKPTIFHTSLLENIRLWNTHYSPEQVMKAAERACLVDVIERLPLGLYDNPGEDGAWLSGGEAQRVSIARAFLKDPVIVVLDEPTSHLDPKLAAQLSASVKELANNRTSLIIAHRVETLKTADSILLIDDGQLVCQGNHTELLIKSSLYQELAGGKGDDQ